jgi:iron uptake system component EfeO
MFMVTLRQFGPWLAIGMSGLALVVGTPAAQAARLDEAAERYRPYLIEDIGGAEAGARRLRDCLADGNLEGAKAAWVAARVGWERSEVFTSGFVPDLDKDIDAWPDARTGFHAIEAKLFGANSTDVLAETDALVRNLADLGGKIRTIPLTPQRLLNGIARLAYEVGESKVDGGESRLSGTSLEDMRNNVDGIELAYRTVFASEIAATDSSVAQAALRQIEQLKLSVGIRDLKRLDSDGLRAASEELVVVLQGAAPQIGLKKPALEETIE